MRRSHIAGGPLSGWPAYINVTLSVLMATVSVSLAPRLRRRRPAHSVFVAKVVGML